MAKNKPAEKKLSIKDRIKLLEEGKITPQEFLSNLSTKLKAYWGVIFRLLEEHRTIRNTLFAEHFPAQGVKLSHYQKLNLSRGMLGKFAEWGLITPLKDREHNVYFCNLPGFYSMEELRKLIPEQFQQNILNVFDNKTLKVDDLASTFQLNKMFMEEILNMLVQYNALQRSRGGYRLTAAIQELGLSPEGITALELIKAQNILLQEEEQRAAGHTPTNLSEIKKAYESDLEHKLVKPDCQCQRRSLPPRLYGRSSLRPAICRHSPD